MSYTTPEFGTQPIITTVPEGSVLSFFSWGTGVFSNTGEIPQIIGVIPNSNIPVGYNPNTTGCSTACPTTNRSTYLARVPSIGNKKLVQVYFRRLRDWLFPKHIIEKCHPIL